METTIVWLYRVQVLGYSLFGGGVFRNGVLCSDYIGVILR